MEFLIAWAATGKPPDEAEDVVPRRALLDGEQQVLFTSIRTAAARSPAADDASCLMRHQAYYLAGLVVLRGNRLAGRRRAHRGLAPAADREVDPGVGRCALPGRRRRMPR